MFHGADRLYSRCFHHVDVHGVNRVPRRGPGLIVCNHLSSLDPVLLQSTISRPVIWMMAREYFELPFLGEIFRALEIIPVARDGKDSTALRAALRALASRRLLGIFPEGRLSKTSGLGTFETGAALIAVRSGATVFPVRLEGTTRGESMVGAFTRPQRVRLHYADPMTLKPDRSLAALEEATASIRATIDGLDVVGKPAN
jgi:1-acyl-sn-glycerol-3-phosphate acyltransferase